MTLARIIKDSTNMEKLLKLNIPKRLLHLLKKFSINTRKIKYRITRRPCKCGETSKAKSRRIKELFFEKYCRGKGLDIGYGGDLLTENCQGFDVEDGDAQYLAGLKNETFDFVYSSHTLEHLFEPQIAIQNWWRVLKSGGYLILYLPERDLYEKKKTLPSRWNVSQEHFFLLDRDESPDTIGIIPLIKKTCPNHEIIYAKICSQGHTITESLTHSDGEYSIEVVLQKLSSEAIIAKTTEGNKFYDHYSQDNSTKFGKWLKTCIASQIFKFAQIEEKASILEIGPGRGEFSDICLRRGIDYWAIEPNEKMADSLEKKGIKVLRNIVPPMPETGRSFDIVMMIHVMEHMDTMTTALQLTGAIYALLNQGGRFVICAPDYINWRNHFFHSDFSHNYVTTLKRLHGLLISAGFKDIKWDYQSGPLKGRMSFVISAIASRLPFGCLEMIFPKNKLLHKLYKLQTTFLRGVLILGEKNNQLKERVT